MKNLPVTIPFFDEKESQNVKKVLDSGWVAQGPVVAEFEEAIASHEGIKYGVATTSCTTALHLAMAAEGMGAGMDALAPAFTLLRPQMRLYRQALPRYLWIFAGIPTILTLRNWRK